MIGSQLHRRRGQRIGPRTRAEAAVLVAAGVPKAAVARQLGIARESLRLFGEGARGELWLLCVEVARRRLAAGVKHHRIVDELCETVEIRPVEPDHEGTWKAIRDLAFYLAAQDLAWNEAHGEELLAIDPNRVLTLAAEHADEPEPGPGCPGRGEIAKAIADACIDVGCSDRESLFERARTGRFIPFCKQGERHR